MIRCLLLAAFAAGGAAEETPEPPEPLEISKTLSDGTVQGFRLSLTADGSFSDFSIRQRPAAESSRATGVIFYAIAADSGKPRTLHLLLDPPAPLGEETVWNFAKEVFAAIEKKNFPDPIAEGTTLTLQFLRGRKGVSVGTPMTLVYGSPPDAEANPARGSTGRRAGECFEERFRACKPARLETKSRIDLAYRYEVLGRRDALCRVRSTFLLHPDEALAGKSMECLYDPEKPFAEAALAPAACSGPLYEAMRPAPASGD